MPWEVRRGCQGWASHGHVAYSEQATAGIRGQVERSSGPEKSYWKITSHEISATTPALLVLLFQKFDFRKH